jgi:hypothetical protein
MHPMGGGNILKAFFIPFSLVYFSGYIFEAKKVDSKKKLIFKIVSSNFQSYCYS